MFLYHSRSAAIDIALIAIAVKRCYRSDSYLKLSLSQRSAAQVVIGLNTWVPSEWPTQRRRRHTAGAADTASLCRHVVLGQVASAAGRLRESAAWTCNVATARAQL